MVNTYFGANLVDKNTINVFIFSSLQKGDQSPINLVINDEKVVKLEIKKQVFLNGIALYTCYYDKGFELGNSYNILIEHFGIAPLNVSEAINFPNFDTEYYYSDDDLGVTYTKEKTTFKIWAPTASKVGVCLRKSKDEDYVIHFMHRETHGVYYLTLDGDYEGFLYKYFLRINESSVYALDPYGKASTANSEDNVVIDFNKVKIDLNEDELPTYESYLDTIIYELHIRDFTIDENTDIVHKGKYLGLAEEGRKTKNGNPAGLDYLKELGITHVQILPMFDYKSVDELRTDKTYNWGYDPWQYFCPEGGYSTNPNDPYSRIIELKQMIASLHKAGIKVNMDVVYNHFFDTMRHSLEKIVPGYFIRKKKDGTTCNGSGCGNDFNSERPMARKMIIDCCKYWLEEFGIDGLRFDLMGLTDIDTILRVNKVCKAIKSDFMVYGEGWDMNTELDSSKKASILNSFKMPGIAYFNDTFRDVLKGNNGVENLKNGGYLTGNISYIDGFKFSFLSGSVNYTYPARFKYPEQSLNYVECHDNYTLFDKVSSIYGKNDLKKVFNIIKQINAVILLSYGTPFFHAGQEIGLSKKYEDNTYNMGDEYNKFRWNLVDERIDMVNFFKSMTYFRRNVLKSNINDSSEIAARCKFIDLGNNLLGIEILNIENKEFLIVINPTDETIPHTFNDFNIVLCGEAGYLKDSNIFEQSVKFLPHTVIVFTKKKEGTNE